MAAFEVTTEGGRAMSSSFRSLLFNNYELVVAVVLIIVVGTIRLIGSKAKTVFSNVARAVRRLERALLPKRD